MRRTVIEISFCKIVVDRHVCKNTYTFETHLDLIEMVQFYFEKERLNYVKMSLSDMLLDTKSTCTRELDRLEALHKKLIQALYTVNRNREKTIRIKI